MAVGRAGRRERDERRRRGEAAAAVAASAAAASAAAPSSSSSVTAPPPPIVTGAVSTLRLRLSHEGVSSQQATLLISHKVQAPPTPASSAATKAAKCSWMLTLTPLSVFGVAGSKNPTLLLRHGSEGNNENESSGGGDGDTTTEGQRLRRAAAAALADQTGRNPAGTRRRKRVRRDGGETPAQVIGPGQTARLRLGDVVVFGGRAVVVEAEATASARRAGVPLSEAFAARFGRKGGAAAAATGAAKGPAPSKPATAAAARGGGAETAAPPLPAKKPPLSGSVREETATVIVSGAAAAAALATAAAARAKQRRAARAATAGLLLPPPPPPPPLDPTAPPPLCVRLSASVANDPFCASLAERARLPLACPGDLASWTVFVVRGPGEGQGGGFSRSLNWLLSLAGRRAVVSPAWLAEAARVAEEGEEKARSKAGREGGVFHDSSVQAPPTAPFALRDPAAESRGRFSLAPELLCGWDDGRIPMSSPGSGKKEAATGKRKAPEAAAGDGEGSAAAAAAEEPSPSLSFWPPHSPPAPLRRRDCRPLERSLGL